MACDECSNADGNVYYRGYVTGAMIEEDEEE